MCGSVVAGYNDLRFDGVGYAAMGVNVAANVVHVHLTKRLQACAPPPSKVARGQSRHKGTPASATPLPRGLQAPPPFPEACKRHPPSQKRLQVSSPRP